MSITREFNLYLHAGKTVPLLINANQFDSGETWLFTLLDASGQKYTPATGSIIGLKSDGHIIANAGTVNAAGQVVITETEQMTAAPGRNFFEILIDNDTHGTANFTVFVERRPGEGGEPSDSDLSIFQQAINAAGTIGDVSTTLDQLQTDMAVQTARIDLIENLPEGSTSGDAALDDIRVGYNGTVYPTPGGAVRGQITDLNNNLHKIIIPSENLYNPATDRHGINIDGTGTIISNETYKSSDYIYVGSGNKVTLQVKQQQQRVIFYTADDTSSFSRALWITGTDSQTFTLSSTENYIVITMLETCPDFMLNDGDTLLPYEPYGGTAGTFLQNVIDDINDTINAEAQNTVKKNIVNRFNPATITSGKYLSVIDGTLVDNADYFASDYIDVSDLTSIKCSYTAMVCFYDESNVFISGQAFNTNNQDSSINKPDNAKYMRFANTLTHLTHAQIGADVERGNYVPYGKYTLPDLIIKNNLITVDASGNGDYTSFTQAVYETVDSGIDILVKAGTYDIVSEYVALFGQEAVDNMADSDSSIFNGFQYGVRLRNRKVTFTSGARLVCDWTGHTVDGTHRFSALGVDYNVEIIGLDLDATATFYAIHDDYGLWYDPYTVKYENCRIIGHSLANSNCIGGGCQMYSRHIINNCYFNNNASLTTVRYHNTIGDGSVPEVFVSNSFFNDNLSFRWYGSQTSKMKAYVNNCQAHAIVKQAESSSYDVDNVELYTWNNQTNG